MVDQIVRWPGAKLDLHPDRPDGLEFHGQIGGTLRCQRNSLIQMRSGKEEPVNLPDDFKGGEGALCAFDTASLVTIGGQPASLEIDGNASHTLVLHAAIRRDKVILFDQGV